MKFYTVAHGHKTQNLIINLDHDEWILDDHSKTLAELGARKSHHDLTAGELMDRKRDGTVIFQSRIIRSIQEESRGE
jgi:hypothetical protein